MVFPVVLLVHRHRHRLRLAVISLAWYVLPALYIWLDDRQVPVGRWTHLPGEPHPQELGLERSARRLVLQHWRQP